VLARLLVDTTTLIVISTIVQTVVITVTLVVFVMQFRSQEKAIKEASYQGLMGRYNDFINTIVEKPVIARLLLDESNQEVSEDEATIYAHLLVAYGIIEEAYLLYVKDWIDEDTWLQWSAWLEDLCERPQMRSIHRRTSGTFDRRFEQYVDNMLKRLDSKSPSAETPPVP
jgi:hypothetical protein